MAPARLGNYLRNAIQADALPPCSSLCAVLAAVETDAPPPAVASGNWEVDYPYFDEAIWPQSGTGAETWPA
jgi:hypothetical protein